MSEIAAPESRRPTAIVLVGVGMVAMLAGVALGPKTALAGAVVLLGAGLLALRELSVPTITWPNVVAAFVMLMWLVPSRGYRLPVTLPFNLEPYRLVLGFILVALVVAVARKRTTLDFGGYGVPVGIMLAAVMAAAILNYDSIGVGPGDPGAIKAVSYFVGFLALFVLAGSTIRTQEEIDTVLRSVAIGAAIVAVSAAYESRVGYNAFEHLHEWIPALVRESRASFDARGGSVRVYASAQHPIALACALMMAFPFTVYLSRRASTVLRSRLWLGAAAACAVGASATISRTTVVMVVAMLAVALWLRPRQVVRYWPLLLVMPVVIHFAVPGALGGIYKAFFPAQGLLATDLYSRPGESGSGRLADVGPGLRLWSQQPFFGWGVGSELTTKQGGSADVAEGAQGAVIYFDNQWMGTLVSVGAVGFIATLWFVWGSFATVARGARRARDDLGDLLTVCAVSLVGFAVGMIVFDAFAFVQVTMFFFLVAALGLRARQLAREREG